MRIGGTIPTDCRYPYLRFVERIVRNNQYSNKFMKVAGIYPVTFLLFKCLTGNNRDDNICLALLYNK